MKITLLQTDIKWNEPEWNRLHAAGMIAAAPGADLYVLPEMFTTGFKMESGLLGETDGALTLEWMLAVSREHGAAVAGSVAVKEEGRFYNRLFFVKPDGTYAFYDKRHLFTYGGEHLDYEPGDRRVIVEWKGVRILLQICYDLRFPVFSRNRGDYDMILYAASWSDERIKVWDALLKARAIENLCYVAGVNRVGSDPDNEYPGHTQIIDFKGEPMADAGEREGMVSALLDIEAQEAFRKKFPALNDADRFTMDI